jgi:hypothetical protein
LYLKDFKSIIKLKEKKTTVLRGEFLTMTLKSRDCHKIKKGYKLYALRIKHLHSLIDSSIMIFGVDDRQHNNVPYA